MRVCKPFYTDAHNRNDSAIIAMAWLRFRPLLSGLIALVSTASFFGPYFYARWNRSAVVQEVDLQLIK